MTTTEDTMSATITRLSAWASSIGDPELLILPQTVTDPGTDIEYVSTDSTPVATHPLHVGDSGFEEDLDVVLEGMGYRRVGQWETTEDGVVTLVEAVAP